eukprot:gene41592-51524_t
MLPPTISRRIRSQNRIPGRVRVRMPDLTPPAQCVRASVPGLSVLTLGELRKGIESMTDIVRRARLAEWMETELPLFFSGRVLAVDQQVADRWGRMAAATGRTMPAVDSLIAATAAYHGLSVVTRNVPDFSVWGLDVINPWDT